MEHLSGGNFAVWADLCGVAGFALYVMNYVCLSTGRAQRHMTRYFARNLCAALLVLASLTQDFNLGSAMVQLFFIGISLFALVSRTALGTQRGQQPS